jgi:hypothetical protein
MFMSMGWDYVSELQPPVGLLFISQVICEHEEKWLNDINRKNILIRSPEISDNPNISHLVANQEELANKLILLYEVSLLYFEWFFNMP